VQIAAEPDGSDVLHGDAGQKEQEVSKEVLWSLPQEVLQRESGTDRQQGQLAVPVLPQDLLLRRLQAPQDQGQWRRRRRAQTPTKEEKGQAATVPARG
jgi:hypothetical protein